MLYLQIHLYMLLTFNKNYLLIKLQREVTQVAMLTNYKNGPILIFITQITEKSKYLQQHTKNIY
jgi:hypothetical protein